MLDAMETNIDDARWTAVLSRDAAQDGRFWYGVLTTGVYCRPSCAARVKRRENVRFFADQDSAKQAGFRPCLRCKPDGASPQERRAALIAKTCRQIEEAETPPSLEFLAAEAGLSPFHFHRLFRQATGVTPKAYASAGRAARVRTELSGGAAVTTALYDAGFNASSRFYEAADRILGMRPSAYRDGGRDVEIRFAVAETNLGALLVAATEIGVCSIQFGEDPQALVEALQDRFPRARLIGADAAFEATVAQVVAYVERPNQDLSLPLDVAGTAFQERVWRALSAIPRGATASYADIAERIGQPRAVRAVAQACAANPTALAIPCHRVVRTDGSLSGYRWGVERKAALLQREAAR
jgi:AraC family transcriptional regulator of adaptative response/methylated-DNA-[protein]-cysteine methyltransferase